MSTSSYPGTAAQVRCSARSRAARSGTGIIGGHRVILSARQYFDVLSKRHLHGSGSFISATVRF
jgi:hypothetical protein